jgi:hypothetical protein
VKSNQCLTIGCVRMLALLLLAASPAFSQTQNKTVEWSKNLRGSHHETSSPDVQLVPQIDGIEIQGFAVGGKSITLREPFAADDDWLRDFTVRVKNVSQRTLLSIQLDLHLSEMTVSPQVVFCYPCATVDKGKSILPGEEVSLTMLPGAFYDWVKKQIAREHSLSQITRAQIEIVLIRLPDEKKWVSGCVKTFDPRNACPKPPQ